MWEFFDKHWFIAFCALFPAATLAHAVLFRLPNRILRTIKVVCRGWPPQHMDADGDFKPEPKS